MRNTCGLGVSPPSCCSGGRGELLPFIVDWLKLHHVLLFWLRTCLATVILASSTLSRDLVLFFSRARSLFQSGTAAGNPYAASFAQAQRTARLQAVAWSAPLLGPLYKRRGGLWR